MSWFTWKWQNKRNGITREKRACKQLKKIPFSEYSVLNTVAEGCSPMHWNFQVSNEWLNMWKKWWKKKLDSRLWEEEYQIKCSKGMCMPGVWSLAPQCAQHEIFHCNKLAALAGGCVNKTGGCVNKPAFEGQISYLAATYIALNFFFFFLQPMPVNQDSLDWSFCTFQSCYSQKVFVWWLSLKDGVWFKSDIFLMFRGSPGSSTTSFNKHSTGP